MARALETPEELAVRCRAAGLKATPQRMAIFRALAESDAHPSPEAVFEAVRPALPSISLATVYKTLDSLEEAGLISEVSQLAKSKRYDANDEHHHHLVCTACGSITDVNHPELDRLAAPAGLGGFEPHEVRIQILGLCTTCRALATKQTPEESAPRTGVKERDDG